MDKYPNTMDVTQGGSGAKLPPIECSSKLKGDWCYVYIAALGTLLVGIGACAIISNMYYCS